MRFLSFLYEYGALLRYKYTSWYLYWGSPLLTTIPTTIFSVCETWMRIYFYRDSWIYIFPSSGNWLRFFVISEICNYFKWFMNHQLSGNNFSLFFGDFRHFSVIKARKLNQNGCKKGDDLPFSTSLDARADGGLRTNHCNRFCNSEPG